MKIELPGWTITIAAVCFASTLAAATDVIENGGERPKNRFGVSYRPGFNISAEFKNLGGSGPVSNPGPPVPGIDHNYDDGYNRVDALNNTHQGGCENCTWNWGYVSESQLTPIDRPGPDPAGFLNLSSTQATTPANADADDEIAHGGEISYQRELGKIGDLYWGVEGAFNYTTVGFENDSTLRGNVTRIVDTYSLTVEGRTVVPPEPPYFGSKGGPGPVISDIPVRTIAQTPGGALIAGSRDLDVDIYGFKAGPYIEWPFADKWSVLFSGGLAVASVNTDFSYSETVTVAGVGNVANRSASDSDSDWKLGAYATANLIYNITDTVDIFAGVEYQYLDSYEHDLDGKRAELHLGQAIYALFGLGFSF